MTEAELQKIIFQGETSKVQFKDNYLYEESIPIVRLFQQSGILYADEMIIPDTSIADVNFDKIRQYLEKIEDTEVDEISRAWKRSAPRHKKTAEYRAGQ